MTRTQRRRVATATRYAILTLWALLVAFPLYWMVTTSFKPGDQWFSWPPVYFPSPPTLGELSRRVDRRHLGRGGGDDLAVIADPVRGAAQQHHPLVRCDDAGGALRVDYRLCRIALPAVVRNPHVSAVDAAHGAADRHRRAALVVFFLYRSARFAVRSRRALFPEQPALCGLDDKKLYRRGAARGRAGGRNPRRLALAHDFRGGAAADPLGAGGDLHVHPDPELERISAGADPVENAMS